MSYTTIEQSVHDSQPIEVFRFIRGSKIYAYAQTDQPVTVNGQLYQPLQITRSGIKLTDFLGSLSTVDVTVPFDCELAKDYAFQKTPDDFVLEIRKVEKGTDYATDWRLIWPGVLSSISTGERQTTFKTVSGVQSDLQAGLSTVYYQTVCNHVLYDARCKANRAANTVSTTIVAVAGEAVEVTTDGFPNGKLTAGEIVNTRTGERRLIVNNEDNLVTLGYPFFDALVGDTVTLTRGCDHSYTTCAADFANIVNYGGYMFIPEKNPFSDGI